MKIWTHHTGIKRVCLEGLDMSSDQNEPLRIFYIVSYINNSNMLLCMAENTVDSSNFFIVLVCYSQMKLQRVYCTKFFISLYKIVHSFYKIFSRTWFSTELCKGLIHTPAIGLPTINRHYHHILILEKVQSMTNRSCVTNMTAYYGNITRWESFSGR
jgi:hypothetical protein